MPEHDPDSSTRTTQSAPAPVDVEALAKRVYELMQAELRIEAERRGGRRPRRFGPNRA